MSNRSIMASSDLFMEHRDCLGGGVLDVRKIVIFCFIAPPISLVEGVIKQLKGKLDFFISCNINLLNVTQPFDAINCKNILN